MFNSKFNPDVVYSFENENKSRINTKYEIKNIPYKVITKENKLIKNQNLNVNDFINSTIIFY